MKVIGSQLTPESEFLWKLETFSIVWNMKGMASLSLLGTAKMTKPVYIAIHFSWNASSSAKGRFEWQKSSQTPESCQDAGSGTQNRGDQLYPSAH